MDFAEQMIAKAIEGQSTAEQRATKLTTDGIMAEFKTWLVSRMVFTHRPEVPLLERDVVLLRLIQIHHWTPQQVAQLTDQEIRLALHDDWSDFVGARDQPARDAIVIAIERDEASATPPS